MQQRNQQSKDRPDDHTGRDHGQQGVDKAPGSETSADTANTVQDTQRAKNKVDGDPSRESDRPSEQA